MHSAPFTLITTDDRSAAHEALARLGLLDRGEVIESMRRAGEGNMNAVIRVTTNQRSMILKQSRPWVEKYPQIEAPAERILAEIDFYRRIEPYDSVRNSMPKLLGFNTNERLMVLADLGEASDYSDLYRLREPESLPLEEAIGWLALLHAIEIDSSQREGIGNRSLRELNHAHMFVIPLQTPSVVSLDAICPGLDELALRVRGNRLVSQAAQRFGDRYLGSGGHLLHGDFYPGSWLRTAAGFRVIDPEFTFAGPVEFDLAVLAAHCVLVGAGADSTEFVAKLYQQAGGSAIDLSLLHGFAAMEIIRRLIGVAQLPLSADLGQRAAMFQTAEQWLVA